MHAGGKATCNEFIITPRYVALRYVIKFLLSCIELFYALNI